MLNIFGGDTEEFVNELLEGAGYQRKVGNNWVPTQLGREYSVVINTNKRHSDGTPVREIKWNTITLNFDKLLES